MGRLKLFGLALLGSAALTFTTAQNADATDLLAEMVNAPPTWTGLYVGGHGGYGFGDSDWLNTVNTGGFPGPVGTTYDTDPDGGFFGGQVGYMHQMGSFVLGVDVSGSVSDIGDDEATAVSPGTATTNIDGIVLAQARLGWAYDNFLFFVQGGYAGAEANAFWTSAAGTRSRMSDRWHHGWTVGGGVKYMIMDGVSLGAEYNYVDLENRTYNVDTIGIPDRARVNHDLHMVRGTVSIHLPYLGL